MFLLRHTDALFDGVLWLEEGGNRGGCRLLLPMATKTTVGKRVLLMVRFIPLWMYPITPVRQGIKGSFS